MKNKKEKDDCSLTLHGATKVVMPQSIFLKI